jgi:type II secretory pathway predicted ATPase ExeA
VATAAKKTQEKPLSMSSSVSSFPFVDASAVPPEAAQRQAMVQRFFGLERDPFADSPDEQFFFSNAAIRQTYRDLISTLCGRPGLALLTGEAGAGKTILIRRLCSELRGSGHLVVARYRAGLDFDDLVRIVGEDMGLPSGSARVERLLRLRDAAEGGGEAPAPVLVIDDADRLGGDVMMNLLHLLAGAPQRSLRVLLAGRPPLAARLELPVFCELRAMLCGAWRLERMEDDDAASYIFHRLRRGGHRGCTAFSPAAINAVVAHSAGVPRRINQLCAQSLAAAAAGAAQAVTAEVVESICEDPVARSGPRRGAERGPAAVRRHAVIAASFCATLVAGGMVLHAMRGRDQGADIVGMGRAVAETKAAADVAETARQPAEPGATGDAGPAVGRSSPVAARPLGVQPVSVVPGSFDLAMPGSARPGGPCQQMALGQSVENCALVAGDADPASAEQGERADAAMPSAPRDAQKDDGDVLSTTVPGSAPAAANARAAEVMSRAQSELEEGHIIAPPGDNALESYREMVAISPDSPEAHLLQQQVRLGLQASARKALTAGDGDAAERLYALAVHPESDLEEADATVQATTPAPDAASAVPPAVADASGTTAPAGSTSPAMAIETGAAAVPASEGTTSQAMTAPPAGDPATTQGTSRAEDAARAEPAEKLERTAAAAGQQETGRPADVVRSDPETGPRGTDAASQASKRATPPDQAGRPPTVGATGPIEQKAAASPDGVPGSISKASTDVAAIAPPASAAREVPGSISKASTDVAAIASPASAAGARREAPALAGAPSSATPKEVGDATVRAPQQARLEAAARSSDPMPQARPAEPSPLAQVPATAPPPSMAPQLVAALVKRGDELVKIGDISGARLAYERAASAGSARAMSALAATYDAAFLARVNARGMQPDAKLAAEWYRKAAALGDAEASLRVRQLPVPAQ